MTQPGKDVRYPIGGHTPYMAGDAAARAAAIETIAALPAALQQAVRGLDPQQLDTPYRDGGWTVRQVVHHVADSHLNAYLRCKLALTAAEPTINAYDEAQWAEFADGKAGATSVSMGLLQALHVRWVHCLRTLPADAFGRRLRHPERGLMTVDDVVGLYAWHGRHHTAHVTALRERRGW
jgi:hypothetical protein